MAAYSLNAPWSLRVPPAMMSTLRQHLFPGDDDEHGAVIGATVVTTSRGTRLLARRLFLAVDSVDYVPGQRGYRMLTADFVRRSVMACEAEGLAYMAVHCHGGSTSVGFSPDDMASHERGYPALLDILDGAPVIGLVFATDAAAGDIWLTDRSRAQLREVHVVGRKPERLYPSPPRDKYTLDPRHDRQARLFGTRGQAILKDQKIGIIGLGGAGALLNEYLARLGVGHIVAIDPDRVELSNLPRIVGARQLDALSWLTDERRPAFLRRFGTRHAATKVRIAQRVARQANPRVSFDGIEGDVTSTDVVERLTDCDYLFLAADSMQARLVVNALVHQYLIPAIQVGAKVQIERHTGDVIDVFSVVRHLTPGEGCLWCNELIHPGRLAEEAATPEQRRVQRYVPEVAAPSVITLNAVAASQAVNDYLFAVTGLVDDLPLRWHKFHPTIETVVTEVPRQDSECPECVGRLSAGPLKRLPTRVRA